MKKDTHRDGPKNISHRRSPLYEPTHLQNKRLLRRKIVGSFYEPELKKTSQDIFRIEKVLEKRGHIKVLVKWLGYPDSFNSWIDAEDVIDV